MKSILYFIAFSGISIILPAQNRFYVNHAATGANNGQTWADAFIDLQGALTISQAGDEIWVSEGTYYPTSGTDRSISFEPKSGVQLYGGFSGNETTLSQRDWSAHATLLSGDIGMAGDSTDNSFNVVYLFQSDSSTVLDGFTLCFGQADNLPGANSSRDRAICGGGLYIEAGNWEAFPNIQNCRFWRNTSNSFGGAAMLNGASDAGVAPRFVNCRFEENRSQGSGGGLARFGGSWAERGKELDGCTFSHNSAGVQGGGLYYIDTQGPNTIALYNCLFENNQASKRGGGAYFLAGKSGNSGLYIQNCRFEGNNAMEGVAIDIFNIGNEFHGEALIDSCVFLRNISTTGGGFSSIIYSDQFGTPQTIVRLSNSRFEGNKSVSNNINFGWINAKLILEGVVIFQDTASTLFASYSVSSVNVKNSKFSSNRINRLSYNNFEGNKPSLIYSDCVFDNNQSSSNLYLFYVDYIDTIFFTNCTFAENNDQEFGVGVIDILTNIILRKEPPPNYLPMSFSLKYYFSYSLLDYPSCFSLPSNVTCGPNNLFNLDPQFRDTANHDYSLLPCSPLINAGSNAAASGILTDIAGNPRIQGGTVDIGAYESPAFALAAEPQVQPSCLGATNGSISVSPVFGCEPYTYNWLPAAGNGPELNGLPPGNYLLTITDGSGRQILDTLEVAEAPKPQLNPFSTDVQCANGLGGSISAGASAGTAPYHYQWQPLAADTAMLNHLSPGAYALTVLDAQGCQDSAKASIALLGMLTPSIDGKSISCPGAADGWLSLTPSTGAAPFTWIWTGWAGKDAVAQPLGPGQYSVTVTDAYGCTASNTFPFMNDPAAIVATLNVIDQTNLITPNGAAIVTSTSGGTPFPGMPPYYQYAWSTGEMGSSIAGLAAGSYTLTVTDSNGCTSIQAFEVQLMVGTGEQEGAAFLLYPNPAADWLRVVLPAHAGKYQVELSDASGRVVRSEELLATAVECQLDLRGLSGGSYWVRVRQEGKSVIWEGKLVKR